MIMAYTNNFPVAAAVAVLFLAVTITPQLTEAQNNTDTVCAVTSPVVEHCSSALDYSNPSKECCNDLKTANKTLVDCLCNNYLLNTSISNTTRASYYHITLGCGVFDKFRCGEWKRVNGGATNKIGASMGLVVLVTNLLFLIH